MGSNSAVPEKKENRIEWLDAAKGWGMLAIIVGHMHCGALTDWLFMFHVPLFFFLSGYGFHGNRKFGEFVERKVRRILVPYFCLGIPMVFCFAAGGYLMGDYIRDVFGYDIVITDMQDVLQLFLQFFLQERMWPIWFLTCLFLLNIIFYLCVRYIHSDLALGALACGLAVAGLLYYSLGGKALIWNLDICLTAFPFMFGGYYFRKRQADVERLARGRVRGDVLALLLLILNIGAGGLSMKLSGEMFEMYKASYGIPALSYLSAFAGIGFILILSRRTTWKPICYIGRNSMIFLAWSQIIMMPLASLILHAVHFSLDAAEAGGFAGLAAYKILQLLLILLLGTIMNEVMIKLKLKFMLGL